MTRLIDADRLIKVIEKAQFEGRENIISIINDAPTVIPEEMKPLIDKTMEILPQLTDAIVENLPRILDDIDICQECEYRKTSFKEADNEC